MRKYWLKVGEIRNYQILYCKLYRYYAEEPLTEDRKYGQAIEKFCHKLTDNNITLEQAKSMVKQLSTQIKNNTQESNYHE